MVAAKAAPARGETAPVMVLLSFATGATDAFAFTALSGVFTANMTGNLILVSLYRRAHFMDSFLGAAVAVAAFTLALYAGFRASRSKGSVSTLGLLIAASAFQAISALTWLLGSSHPTQLLQDGVVAVSSAAMALQTVAAKRARDDRSISTTFLTGTLTGLMQDIADGVTGERWLRLLLIAALPVGALAGALVMDRRPELGGVVPTLTLLICVGLELRQRRCWTQLAG